MRKALRYLGAHAMYLIVVALFWAAALFTLPQGTGVPVSGEARAAVCALIAALILCSFIAALFLSDSMLKNFIVIALLAGIFLVAIRPFAHPMDEEYHFLRAFDLTNGRFLPGDAGGFLPVGYEQYAARNVWTSITVWEHPELWFSPVEELAFAARVRSASYLGFGYIPAALGMGLARLIRLPLVGIVLAGRLFNYLFYVGLCGLAISRTKALRSLIFLASLSTGVLVLTGTLSTDLPLIGSALLFAAICFHYCFDEDAGARVGTGDIVLLALAAAMVASIKYFGYVLILPLLLFMPRGRYENKKQALLFVAGALVIVAALQIIALLRYQGSVDSTGRTDTDTRLQLMYILENPLRYVTMLAQDMLGGLFERLLGQHEPDLAAFAAIGAFGAMLPMAGALLAQDKPALDDRGRRCYALYGLIAALVMQALCCTALYISWTPVGESTIWSVQPRYTLPFYILIMLALSMPRVENRMKNWSRLIGLLTLINVLNSTAGLSLSLFL